jgi:hypothetical protein
MNFQIKFDHVWTCLNMFEHVWSCLIIFDELLVEIVPNLIKGFMPTTTPQQQEKQIVYPAVYFVYSRVKSKTLMSEIFSRFSERRILEVFVEIRPKKMA